MLELYPKIPIDMRDAEFEYRLYRCRSLSRLERLGGGGSFRFAVRSECSDSLRMTWIAADAQHCGIIRSLLPMAAMYALMPISARLSGMYDL